MRKWLALVVACLALGLVVAGCGDDDEDEGGGGGGAAQTQEETATDTGGGEGNAEVSMRDIKFNPETVTIAAGGTVTWTNDESVPHDVQKTGGPGREFSSGEEGGMQQGDTFDVTLEEPGTYEYLCRVHAGTMKGTIEVR